MLLIYDEYTNAFACKIAKILSLDDCIAGIQMFITALDNINL
jgi:hypothetical protein